MDILKFNTNPFGGVLVDPLTRPADPQGFRTQLAYSMDEWTVEGYKVAWLEVPLDKSGLVPVAVEAGFTYHHADDSYVMMTNQLEQNSYIPPYATHYIGAGAVVVSEKRELLVVSERYKFRGSRGPAYKLPGGALQPGDVYAYTFGPELEGSTVPYHNHLSPELGGTVMVLESAPEGGVEIDITATGYTRPT